MKEEEVAGLRVADLRDELKSRGLAVTGLKAALAERLLGAIRQENAEAAEPEAKDAPQEEQPKAVEEEKELAKEDTLGQAPGSAAKNEPSAAPESNKAADEIAEPKEAASIVAADETAEAKEEPDMKEAPKDVPNKEVSQEPDQDAPDAKAADEATAEEFAVPTSDAAKDADEGAAAEEEKPADRGDDLQEGSASPQPRHRELAAERAEAPAPVPVQDAAEEEVDYEADEVIDEVPTAPEEPAPHEARRPRAQSEAKSAAEGKSAAGKASEAGGKKGTESTGPGDKAADKDDAVTKDGKRKRAPIPIFVPREKRAAAEANGDKTKGSDAADAPERAAKLARTDSNDKRSVFERLKSGSGKEEQADQGADVPPKRAPSSREAASCALLITGFIRPFTEKQAQQKLSETGEITGFWMTKIKDRAYVIYATEEQAEATRQAVTGIEWPLGNGNSLRPKFVPVEDAEESIKTGVPQETRRPAAAAAAGKPSGASAQVAAAAAAAAEPNNRAAAAKPADSITKTKRLMVAVWVQSLDARAILEERRRARGGKSERAPEVAADAADPEPMDEDEPKSLEDLFRKTTTRPWLYWVPLTDDQVAEKAKKDAAALPGPPPTKK
ncbi:hypothetical protein COCSUDRAFT_65753 [Coccomyxa subellipsoidea C-169]|uniref:SAP domain-containing protein n=1 Tax=Coccomyxa subellipsoidea (strain C-169) TaxID=574566 RepID=I0Z0F2_COCSC|nr:hypothetical protein COCSUDRAFT_65753 [Coccomyxa subellipsoidea C-169]EIE24121.1 hypothetical protein COCSUDRAFT_65753 [Coccomyxa subellipsoidea C-169]|eukprot:XP_005648665.1 hypothetical protein COCSUDRAFT_65753 [Coccomyxa subellipsoidea C-169]